MAVLNFADVSKNAEFGYTLVFKGIFLFQATRYSPSLCDVFILERV